MKRIGFAGLFLCLPPAFLLAWFAFAAQAAAQGPVFSQLNRLPKLQGKMGNTHKANTATAASGYKYEVLYSFCAAANCTDGANPNGSLIEDAAGNLYGTTFDGGAGRLVSRGGGTVFELQPPKQAGGSWTETVLYSFCSAANCTDGEYPYAGLIQDTAGNLYGTTYQGGANDATKGGDGTVFELQPPNQAGASWTETVLYSFCSAAKCTDGEYPNGGLIEDAAGNLYGTTYQGGDNNFGTVFELDNAGHYTVLYSFGTNQSGDGANPTGGLIQDAAGNLYGATSAGGAPGDFYGQYGDGTVFEVDTTGQETALYDFCLDYVGSGSCPDGAVPNGGLVLQNATVNLYGVTTYGGCGPFDDADCAGFGTVFRALAGGYDEWTFYSFCSAANCADGANPNGPLIEDAADNLYGTTTYGGANNTAKGGEGTVFKLDNAGYETVLYSFCSAANCTDGALPFAGPIQDVAGNLYGTTAAGGANGGGTVFELMTLPATTTVLSSSPNPSAYGQPVTFAAEVASSAGAPPNGETVTFMSGTKTLRTKTLSGGSASLTTSTLAVGSYSVTAVYGGDADCGGSTSNAVSQVVNKATTTTTLKSSVNPSAVGQPVTFTAKVTPEYGGKVSGNVIFYDGTKRLKNVEVKAGAAKYTTKTLAEGKHGITTKYNGSTSFIGSTSPALTQTVE